MALAIPADPSLDQIISSKRRVYQTGTWGPIATVNHVSFTSNGAMSKTNRLKPVGFPRTVSKAHNGRSAQDAEQDIISDGFTV